MTFPIAIADWMSADPHTWLYGSTAGLLFLSLLLVRSRQRWICLISISSWQTLKHRLKPTSGQSEIEVVKDYRVLPLVECFVGKWKQVLMHLLSNAIDALQENIDSEAQAAANLTHTLTIQTQLLNAERVQIVLENNGAGTPEAMQHKLLDPFFTTKIVGKGTGLGLSISDQIIERHGGTLKCVSAPEQGAGFYIEIPITQAAVKGQPDIERI